jgi:formate hydrogenlyase subunit 3/multisubunit Na+/H+ antiporter MnhD subunit
MNINLPFLLLTIPLIVGAVTHLLNRWVWAQSIIAGGAMLILALFAAQVPIGQTAIAFGREVVLQASWQVLGRTFNFASSDRPALLFGYLTATFFFFGAAATRVPRNFIPLACVLLSLLAATIFVEPFLFAALFLEIMAIAAAFLLCDPEFSNTRGAMRLLVLFSLGVPFILLAGWQLEGLLSNPENANLVESAILLLSIGFVILLAIVPFHSWVPIVAEDAPSYSSAYILTIIPAAVTFFLLNTFEQLPGLQTNVMLLTALRWGGIASIILGGIFASGQRNFGRLLGYSVLIDFGATNLALSLHSTLGLQVVFVMLVTRTLGLAVWGLGLGALSPNGADDFIQLRGKAIHYPFTALSVLIGGLSVAGFPLTVGFVGRWAFYQQLAQENLTASLALLFASGAVLSSYGLGVWEMLAPHPGQAAPNDLEPIYTGIYAGAGVAIIILLGLFPQWLLPNITQLAQAFGR